MSHPGLRPSCGIVVVGIARDSFVANFGQISSCRSP